MEPYTSLMLLVFFGMASLGLLMSGMAAMKQAALAKRLFTLRQEQMRWGQAE